MAADQPEFLECPHLGLPVELTPERRRHIESLHGDLLPHHFERLIETVREPDFVGYRPQRQEQGFCRYWEDLAGGRSIVVVVVGGTHNITGSVRYWVVTAYIARSTRTWIPL